MKSKDSESVVRLKPGKEKAILQRHHWIFSGAIDSLPSHEAGDVLSVISSEGKFLGRGYFNRASGIAGRMISFDETPVQEAIESLLEQALKMRNDILDITKTTGYRIVNGEGDSLPGLIIDRYGSVCVMQSSTAGVDRMLGQIVDWLMKRLSLDAVYEKSTLSARKEEGLAATEGVRAGILPSTVDFLENGYRFIAPIQTGQKTGFFLDQREMRALVQSLAKGKRVLNAFSYTGGFSLYALAGGALSVTSVDVSNEALAGISSNLALNGLENRSHRGIKQDVFNFLRDQEDFPYDLVILDPPAFAKKKRDVVQACRGYKEINRQTLKHMRSGSLFLTCSCSYHVGEELFQKVLFQAALEAERRIQIIGKHRLAADHPINPFHPESQYLKSFLCYVD